MAGLFGGGQTTNNVDQQIGDFQINSATYGVVVPLVLGTSRISGNIIDWLDFTPIAHTTSQHAGKGGGTTVNNTTWTYTVAVLIGLAEGPGTIGKVWRDKEILSNLASAGLTMFAGNDAQSPWSYVQSKHPEKALPYSGLAYAAGVVATNSSGGISTYGFEFKGQLRDTGDGIDVNPADAINFIVTDLNAGTIDAASLDIYRKFCTAADLLISVPLTDTQKGHEIIKDICKMTNTIGFWSQNKLKLVPRCDERLQRGSVIYEPITIPEYDLDQDDFLEGSEVIFEREDNSEAYNHVTIEFLNRANGCEKETAEYKIQSDINKRGLRSMPNVEMHYIHTKPRAEYVASLLAMDSLYGRNKYKFKLGWSHCLLEPGDFVTIKEDSIGPNKIPVTVASNEEDEDGQIEIVAKGRPPGIYSPARYTAHQASRPSTDFNVSTGDVVHPVFFEPPIEVVKNGLELCVAATGNEFWGGSYVWASYDGNTYKQIGEIKSIHRYGTLTTKLKDGLAKDYQNSFAIKLVNKTSSLSSGTPSDADMKNTLCYVDGEYISYETAELTNISTYQLSGLRRGVYSSEIKEHPEGSNFVRVDENIFHYPYRVEDIGQTIHIKFTSYNVFGTSLQDLADVQEYQYTIGGSGRNIPNVTFVATQNATKIIVTLDKKYADQNNNSFFTYELRYGSSWDNSTLISTFTGSDYTFDAPCEGTLTFWLKAYDHRGNYSKNATKNIINVKGLPKRNILFERTENIDNWTVESMFRVDTGYSIKSKKVLGDFDKFFDMFGVPNYLSDIAYIYLPRIDLGENIIDSDCYYVDADGNWRLKTIETLADYATFFDMFGATVHYVTPKYALQTFANVTVKYDQKANVRVDVDYSSSFDGKTWSEWSPSSQKQFYGRYAKIRVHPISLDGLANTIVHGASITIDVPDTEDVVLNIPLLAQKTHISFHKRFTIIPMVGAFVQDNTGKKVTDRITNVTVDGFDIELLDDIGNLISGKLVQAIIRGY